MNLPEIVSPDEWETANTRILAKEKALTRELDVLAAERRRQPMMRVEKDYEFQAPTGPASLLDLFEGRRQLFVYNFMFPERVGSMTPCPSCTSIIDAIDGASRHLVHRIDLVVVAKAPIERFRDHARKRGWRHARLVSSAHNDFNRDYGAEGPDGQQFPLAHVFQRRGKKIRHSWSSELWFAGADSGQDMRHVDFMWPMWSILDCTPEGRGKTWGPQLEY